MSDIRMSVPISREIRDVLHTQAKQLKVSSAALAVMLIKLGLAKDLELTVKTKKSA